MNHGTLGLTGTSREQDTFPFLPLTIIFLFSEPQRDACCPLLITSPSCNITLYVLDPNTLAACSFSEPSLHPACGVGNTLDGSQPDDTLLIPSSPF